MEVCDEVRDAGQIVGAGMARGWWNRRRAAWSIGGNTSLWGRWCWVGHRQWWEPVNDCGCVLIVRWDKARREGRAWWRCSGGDVGGGDVDAPQPGDGRFACPGKKRVSGGI